MPSFSVGRLLNILLMAITVYAGCLLLVVPTGSASVLKVSADFVSLETHGYLHYFKDQSGVLGWPELLAMGPEKWTAVGDDVPSFGFDEAAYWFKLPMQNEHTYALQMLLAVEYPVLDDVHILIFEENRLVDSYQLGDEYPFSERPIFHRHFVAPINLQPAQSVDVLIRVASQSSVQVPVVLWDREHFFEYHQHYLLGQGAYFGVLLVMAIYNLFIFSVVRQTAYVFYSISVLSMGVFFVSIDGLGFQYLWPNLPALNHWITPFSLALLICAAALFNTTFLRLKQQSPLLHKFMVTVASCFAGLMALSLILPYQIVIKVEVVLAIVLAVMALSAGIHLFRKGISEARYFLVARAFVWVGGIIFAFNKLGYLPRNYFTEHALQLSALVEIVLLSLALADRINEERRQKFLAQQRALQNEKLVRDEKERYIRLRYSAQIDELKAREKLVASEAESKAKSEFLAVMSHEIRTPMNGMLGMAELLKDAPMEPRYRRYLDLLSSSGEALVNIINDVLDYSKIAAGKLELELMDFNLQQLCTDCTSLFSVLADRKRLAFRLDFEPGTPIAVRTDPTRLRQVLLNLLGNAFKFTHRGKVTLYVRLLEQHGDDVRIQFEVEDTGIGMSQEKCEQLFQPFSQGDVSTTRQYGGTGLGLSISQSLVKLLGGDIEVESGLSEGSRFRFAIQCQLAEADTSGEARTSDSEQHLCLTEGRLARLSQLKKKVLVAEDNLVNQLVVGGMLSRLQIKYDTVSNGEEALKRLRKHHADYCLVLMDCEMPVLDGYQATRALREFEAQSQRKPLTVIALTAHVMEDHKNKLKHCGMNGALPKPLHFTQLCDLLDGIADDFYRNDGNSDYLGA